MPRNLELERIQGEELKRRLIELYDRLVRGDATLPDVVLLLALEPNRRRRLALYDEVARIADAESDETWTTAMVTLRKGDTTGRRKRAHKKLAEKLTADDKKRIKSSASVIAENLGKPVREIAKLAGLPKSTVHRWMQAMKKK